MRARTAFNPRPTPRLATPSVSASVIGTPVQPNPYVSPIPPLAYDEMGQLRNMAAAVGALKDAVESLSGNRGDTANRAVTFKDLVDYGVLSAEALSSPRGTLASVVPAYFTPADPVGTSVAEPGVMMGLKAAFQPGANGAFVVGAAGACTSDGPLGTVAVIRVRVGTAGPPEHGDPPSGVVIGTPVVLDVVASGSRMSWAFTGVGLNYDRLVPVWLDISLATDFGTATLSFVNITTLGV